MSGYTGFRLPAQMWSISHALTGSACTLRAALTHANVQPRMAVTSLISDIRDASSILARDTAESRTPSRTGSVDVTGSESFKVAAFDDRCAYSAVELDSYQNTASVVVSGETELSSVDDVSNPLFLSHTISSLDC